VVDAGEKAHALAGLIQQRPGDFGARPVAGLAVVRRGGAEPLLASRVVAAGGEYLQAGEARCRRLRAGVVDADKELEIRHTVGASQARGIRLTGSYNGRDRSSAIMRNSIGKPLDVIVSAHASPHRTSQ
jgi:hypothetical protein